MVTSGILILIIAGLKGDSYGEAIGGTVLGITSSGSLAIILVLTSIILQHDTPVRLGFYQCGIGLAFYSLSLLILSIFFSHDIVHIISETNIIPPVIEGCFYALALICFFQAFYYVDPLIVSVSAYSLDLYSIGIDWFFEPENINALNLTSSALIALGAGLLLREEYKEDKERQKQEKKKETP